MIGIVLAIVCAIFMLLVVPWWLTERGQRERRMYATRQTPPQISGGAVGGSLPQIPYLAPKAPVRPPPRENWCLAEIPSPSPGTVPDLLAPVIGYRCWLVSGGFIASLNQLNNRHIVWLPREPLIATLCEESCDGEDRERGCRRGIYAWKSPAAVFSADYHGPQHVFGKVALWGRLIEHEEGWRAEFAYPLEFICQGTLPGDIDTPHLRLLRERYLG